MSNDLLLFSFFGSHADSDCGLTEPGDSTWERSVGGCPEGHTCCTCFRDQGELMPPRKFCTASGLEAGLGTRCEITDDLGEE